MAHAKHAKKTKKISKEAHKPARLIVATALLSTAAIAAGILLQHNHGSRHPSSVDALVGFCEDRAAELETEYRDSRTQLEAKVKGSKDLGAEMKTAIESSTPSRASWHSQETVSEVLAADLPAFKKDYQELNPASLQSNPNAISILLGKVRLADALEKLLDATIKNGGLEYNYQLKSATQNLFLLNQYGSIENKNLVEMGKLLAGVNTRTADFEEESWQDTDYSGRKLTRKAKLGLSFKDGKPVIEVLSSQTTLSPETKTERDHVKAVITDKFRECLTVLKL